MDLGGCGPFSKSWGYNMASSIRNAFICFKGQNNSSSILVNALSQKHYLLTKEVGKYHIGKLYIAPWGIYLK